MPPRDASTPTPDGCRAILEAHGVPPHIRRHSEQVARVARRIARALRDSAGEVIDIELLEAAALLHDIAKASCLTTRRDHAAEGGETLASMGYCRIAALVERHVELGSWDPGGGVAEVEVLNYSDKRVLHEDVVTLTERFQDLIVRYGGGNPFVEDRIRRNWRAAEALERKIFSRVPFGPEELTG